MLDNEIQELLRKNNPFISSASPLPWDNMNPDLAQLNRETSDNIEQLIRHKRRNPSIPLAGLILGEAGSGKTHMLTRILRRLRSNAQFAIFVTVKTFKDPNSAVQHLLSEIFISLKRIHSAGKSQFDMLMSEFIKSYQEHRRNEGITRTDNIDIKKYLSRDIPGLDRYFLKCIMLYIGTSDEDTRSDVIDWLNEGLDEEDSMSLGLPVKDIYAMTDEKREHEAEKVLMNLGLMLAYAKVSMIICFDQLDSMKDNRKLIDAWGNLIALMVNDLSGILPLCFLRAATWNENFVPVLDDAVKDRLWQNVMFMKSCTLEQARQIIQDRINYAFKEEGNAKEIYAWLINKLQNNLKPGSPTRMVIELANHVINNTSVPTGPERDDKNDDSEDIIRDIQETYKDEYNKVQAEPHIWPPNTDQLALTLNTWLEVFDGFIFSSSELKSVKSAGYYRDRIFEIIIVTAKNSTVACATIKHGINFLKINGGGYCCYITEDKIHKKTWKKANELMKAFKDDGGQVIILDSNSRIKWYALTALINRVDNGDVNLYLKNCNRIATRDDLKLFMRRIKLFDFPFLGEEHSNEIVIQPEIDTSEQSREISDDDLITTLKDCVKNSPMKILSTDKALELLVQRDILVTREKLLELVKDNSNVFRTFTSQNDEILITFARKK